MSCLAPCPACNRHVSSDETVCPFCSAALPESFGCRTGGRRPPGRLSRAAMLVAGAVMLGAEACDDNVVQPPYGSPPPPVDAAADAGTTDGGPVALYGAAPPAPEQGPTDTGKLPPERS